MLASTACAVLLQGVFIDELLDIEQGGAESHQIATESHVVERDIASGMHFCVQISSGAK